MLMIIMLMVMLVKWVEEVQMLGVTRERRAMNMEIDLMPRHDFKCTLSTYSMPQKRQSGSTKNLGVVFNL